MNNVSTFSLLSTCFNFSPPPPISLPFPTVSPFVPFLYFLPLVSPSLPLFFSHLLLFPTSSLFSPPSSLPYLFPFLTSFSFPLPLPLSHLLLLFPASLPFSPPPLPYFFPFLTSVSPSLPLPLSHLLLFPTSPPFPPPPIPYLSPLSHPSLTLSISFTLPSSPFPRPHTKNHANMYHLQQVTILLSTLKYFYILHICLSPMTTVRSVCIKC